MALMTLHGTHGSGFWVQTNTAQWSYRFIVAIAAECWNKE